MVKKLKWLLISVCMILLTPSCKVVIDYDVNL